MRTTTILTAAAISLVGLGLSGCDEPAYDGSRDRPEYTSEQQTQPAAGRQRSGGGGGGSGSALGAARGAADRTADRAAQHQERIQREIDDD